jgi:hypothetical protein
MQRPFNGLAAPIQIQMLDAVSSIGADVVMSGELGDLYFAAFPIVVLDLLRAGRWRTALQCVRAFDQDWSYRYGFTAKVVARGLTPSFALDLRERTRDRPPWLVRPSGIRVREERSDSAYLRKLLLARADPAEVPERMSVEAGARLIWPFADRGVLDVALQLPGRLRVPMPPKMVLERAFLAGHEEGLVKASISPLARALAPAYQRDFPSAYGGDSLGEQRGLVRRPEPADLDDERWTWETLDLVGLEMWLSTMVR